MESFFKITNINDLVINTLFLILVITAPAATSSSNSSLVGISILVVFIISNFIRKNDSSFNYKNIIKQLPFILFTCYYVINKYQYINYYIFAYIFLFFILSILKPYLKKNYLKNIYFLLLLFGLIQIIGYYLFGLKVCFFNYQCALVERLNFFDGFYRSNSLLFEPGDFACFSILLSTLAFKPQRKIIYTDLIICTISLSAASFFLFIAKLIIYNLDLKLIYAFIKNLIQGLIEKRNILLFLITTFLIFLIINYLIYKGLGTTRDAAFTQRAATISSIIQTFFEGKILTGGGFELYRELRLVDSLTYGISILAVQGLIGLSIAFISSILFTTDIRFPILLFISRFNPTSLYIILLIYFFILFNKKIENKPIKYKILNQ